jgi:hypothetical protein
MEFQGRSGATVRAFLISQESGTCYGTLAAVKAIRCGNGGGDPSEIRARSLRNPSATFPPL